MIVGPNIDMLCFLHWMQKMHEISDIKHVRHTEYPAWRCDCSEHTKLKEVENEAANKSAEISNNSAPQKDEEDSSPSYQQDLIDSFPSSPIESNSSAGSDIDKHSWLNWTFCYDDECIIHMSEKQGSEYWP